MRRYDRVTSAPRSSRRTTPSDEIVMLGRHELEDEARRAMVLLTALFGLSLLLAIGAGVYSYKS
jgi:hypothetical protein